MAVTSEEVNFLIFRYLQESGASFEARRTGTKVMHGERAEQDEWSLGSALPEEGCQVRENEADT